MRSPGWSAARGASLRLALVATCVAACHRTPRGFTPDDAGVAPAGADASAIDAPSAVIDASTGTIADASTGTIADAAPDALDAATDASPDASADARADAGPDPCPRLDTDRDGWSDDLERAVGTDPDSAADTPPSHHLIVFQVPYRAAPEPARHDIATRARLARADLVLLVDTTGSMTGTLTRIGGQFQALITLLAGQVDDLAFGAAGYGDFPVHDGANSDYDVPFYRVHRVMTARTAAGLASIQGTMTFRSIIRDGLGPWFASMRGGDEPEQGWEALRQVATGVGIAYPGASGGTESVPPFAPAASYPPTIPAGEEVGIAGGIGFRAASVPIVLMVTDTNHHATPVEVTTPTIATAAEALAALAARRARVVGLMAWKVTGHDDLRTAVDATSARVAPGAWGTGADRPSNCPVGRCCVVAEDSDTPGPDPQPLPVDGACSLVFQSDRYDTNLGQMIAQAVTAIAHGAPFAIAAQLRDAPGDAVDTAAFVARLEALTTADCDGGGTARDTDGDGVLDTFDGAIAGSRVCFRVTVRPNTTVAAARDTRAYPATLQLTGDGLAAFTAEPLRFVVPGTCPSPPAAIPPR